MTLFGFHAGLLNNCDFFRVEKRGRGGGGANHLPEWVIRVGNQVAGAVVIAEELSLGVVGHRPGASRIQSLGHHQQPRAQAVAAQSGVAAEDGLEFAFQALLVVTGPDDPLAEPVPAEDIAAQLLVLLKHLPHGHAQGQAGGNDGPCRSASDQIEIIAEAEVRIVAVALPQSLLKGLQIPESQDSLKATAIQRQDALGTGAHEVEILRELAVSGGHGGRDRAIASPSWPQQNGYLAAVWGDQERGVVGSTFVEFAANPLWPITSLPRSASRSPSATVCATAPTSRPCAP